MRSFKREDRGPCLDPRKGVKITGKQMRERNILPVETLMRNTVRSLRVISTIDRLLNHEGLVTQWLIWLLRA